MKKLVFIAAVVTALFCEAETLRLKYLATVEVLNDAGKVVGTRKLKAGTFVSIDTPEALAQKDTPENGGKNLTASDLSPMMIKATRPASGATLRVEAKLDDDYYGIFSREKFWSVRICAYDSNWDDYETFDGFISKSTRAGKKFIELSKDGKTHRFLMKVTFAKDGVLDNSLLIQDLEPLPDVE